MGWLADVPSGEGLTISAGYDAPMYSYDLMEFTGVSAGPSFDVNTSLADGASGTYTYSNSDGSYSGEGTFDDGDVISFHVPSGADTVTINFTMFDLNYDPSDPNAPDSMGSLTFSNVTLPDITIGSDLLKFGAPDGVFIINAEAAPEGIFPVYGESSGLAVKTGKISEEGEMNLGTVGINRVTITPTPIAGFSGNSNISASGYKRVVTATPGNLNFDDPGIYPTVST